MNHPKPEEWVPYVYGETTGAARSELRAHLNDCPHCRQEIEAWQRTVHHLDSWKLPKPGRVRSALVLPLLRWAAAAALLLAAGIVVGRATAPRVDLQQVRRAIIPEIRAQLSAEMTRLAREEAARAASLTMATGRRYTDQVAQQLYVALKKDLDTVALNTDAGLRHAAQQLVELADYRTPTQNSVPNQ